MKIRTFDFSSKFSRFIIGMLSGYNHSKYWRRREYVITVNNNGFLLKKLYYLFWIKRVDYRNLCSFGTNLNSGPNFIEPPHLPHGPNGIIVDHDLTIGRNVTIYQQATIMHGGI